MRILAHIFVVFVSGVLLGSCYADPDCISLRNDILGISFRKKTSNETDTVNVNGITISNSDSIFSPLMSVTKIYLPLEVNSNQQAINFDFSKGKFFMVVDYLSQPQFESVECGPRFVLSDLKVSQHDFDSVHVSGSTPLVTSVGTNIIVYIN